MTTEHSNPSFQECFAAGLNAQRLTQTIGSDRAFRNGVRFAEAAYGVTQGRGGNGMKVKFYCDSGANIHSCREEVIDVESDFGISDAEWIEMSDDDKFDLVRDWANQRLEIGWKERL